MHLSDLIDGRFRITGALGAGGMGEVFRARDERLQRDVAIKVLPESLSADSDRLARFEREARAAAALNHPNILALHDLGYHQDAPYLVTELLEGESLRARIGRGPMRVKEAVGLAVQMARGLAAAHAGGIVHRDLKPENVFVTADGTLKILDFGLARLLSAPDDDVPMEDAPTRTDLTGAGAVLGTVGYMAPEQVRGRDVDRRADIFSFGCVLYEMLAGRRTFARDSAADTLAAILEQEPAPVEQGRNDLSPALAQVVRQCLEKRPEQRFSSAHDLSLALQASVSDVHTTSAPVGAAPRSRRRLLVAGLAVAVVVIVVVAMVWLRGDRGGGEPVVALDPARVLVADFENLTGDASLDPIAAMTADAITQGLVELGEVEVVPAADGGAAGDGASLRAAAREAGAGTVVSGSYYLAGGTLDLRARVIDTESGNPIYALRPETCARDQPGEAIERVRQRVMGALVLHRGLSPMLGVLTTPPLHPAYLECMAGLHATASSITAALPHLERAAELDPEFWYPQIMLLVFYEMTGNAAKLEAMGRHLLENQDRFGPSDRLVMQYVQARVQRRKLEALRQARRILAIAPRDVGWMSSVADLALDLNRPREALECLGDLEEIPWDRLSSWTQGSWMISYAAFAHHLLGEHEAELEVVRFGQGIYPDSLLLPQDEVRALAALGRVAEVDRVIADSQAIRARAYSPGEVLLTAAQELRAHGFRDEARQIGKRCADWYGRPPGEFAEHSSTQLNRLECLWLAERWDEARMQAEQSFETHPEDLYVIGYRGIAAARGGEHEVAEAMDRQLAEMDGRLRASSSWLRACIAAQLGQRERATDLLNEAIANGFTIKGYLHVFVFLEPLSGYPPFEELLEPKG